MELSYELVSLLHLAILLVLKIIELTFMLYGYNSRTELTPPLFLTSSKQRFRVDSWLYTGKSASDTGSERTMRW